MRFLILALILTACGAREAPARSWHDDPSSNAYGPKTSVVWVGGNDATYHRLKCPYLQEPKRPMARYAITDEKPCDLCKPGGRDE